MELKNLNELRSGTESKYHNSFSPIDIRLPKSFKELITQFDNDNITYNEFSFVVQRTSEGKIVAPNQWLYIAAFYSSFYKELLAYKEELYNYLLPKYNNKKNALEEPIKNCFGNFENAQSLLEDYPDGQNKDFLIRFLSDYKWWGGAKTIDRSDFCASAILSSAGLVNAAQGYVADICKFLAKNSEAENILLTASISEADNYTTTAQEELLRQLSAATFLRKALKIVDTDDPNLSKLEALDKYKETNKQLKINGFNLWRKKDELPLRLDDVYQDLEISYNSQMYVMYLEWTPADMERLFFPVFNMAYDGLFKMGKDGNEYVLYKLSQSRKTEKGPLQQIFYGAPGTGKSDTIYETTKDLPQERVYRTTFHPDSDYSTFVGCYKPIMKRQYRYDGKVKAKYYEDDDLAEAKKDDIIVDKVIQYNFIPQAFTNAYIKAWQTAEPVYLIIEEINRGNCAQIFGDLFQLLDRDENGYSKYPINADTDLKNFLAEKFADSCRDDIKKEIKEGYKLRLPNNLYIWATMNTSDQSLFPIDSAFKRRWDWKYIKIKKGINKETKKELDWKIKVGDDSYDWWEFLKAINYKIDKMTSSADKQLGYFFCLADRNGDISADTFVNKVAFYLWNDVFKDYAEDGSPLLKYKKKEDDQSESDLTFPDFFDESGNVDTNVVKQFIGKVLADEKTDNKPD